MRRVVADASVVAAVCFGEPDADAWGERLDGAALFAPTLLQYELQSVARKKCTRHPDRAPAIVRALALALHSSQGLVFLDPDPTDVVLLAAATGLTTYDASYLCLAGMLDADLMTRDARLAAALDPYAERG